MKQHQIPVHQIYMTEKKVEFNSFITSICGIQMRLENK